MFQKTYRMCSMFDFIIDALLTDFVFTFPIYINHFKYIIFSFVFNSAYKLRRQIFTIM